MKNITDDCISRQAAIGAINSMFAPTPIHTDMKENCLEIIENLPSAQPEPEIYWGYTSERPLADVEIVPRLRTIQRQVGGSYAIDRAIEIIEAVASAQPEIIRCKDCRWQKDQSGSTAWLPCRALVTPDEFYCGRAERRTDDTGRCD